MTQHPGGGLNVGGGLLGLAEQLPLTAASGAAGSAGMMAPGAGASAAVASQAAQIGIDEINRAISAGSQIAGIGAQGFLESFHLNDSALAELCESWAGRILGAAANAKPSLPNMAGAQTPEQANVGGSKQEMPTARARTRTTPTATR